MPVIKLITHINAAPEIVFDLSRSVDLHKISTAHTQEEVVAGRTAGLIEQGESVTWRAKHLGITQTLTSVVTEYNRPYNFTDVMLSGAFAGFKHDHIFEHKGKMTVMTDVFDYTSPYKLIGRIADTLFLKDYMRALLEKRNAIIKEYAEDSNKHKKILQL